MPKLQVNKPIDIETDKRYLQHNRGHSITDVYDGLVELITNADDSYGRLYSQKKRNEDGGDILIETQEQRKGQPSILVVRDKAEGMSSDDFHRCLATMGRYSAEAGSRGYMGRGAKDCTALGDVTFTSIKNDRLYECRLTTDLKCVLQIDGRAVTASDRQALGIIRGSGTSVRIELAPGIRLPRFESLTADIPWHYSLRDIMAEVSSSRVLLRKLGTDEKQHLVFRPPDGIQVVDEDFLIHGYPGATAHLSIWRAPERLDEHKGGARFERFGLMIKGRRAIHECSLLSDDLKRNPHASRYFGRIDCAYLDELLDTFEKNREKGVASESNPCLAVDPNRRAGLERKHPFVDRLLQLPIQRLQQLIASDREEQQRQEKRVANDETEHRLNRLARLAGKFLQQQIEDLEELSPGDAVDENAFAKKGISIYPTYPRLLLGQERGMTLYVKKSLLRGPDQIVHIKTDSPGFIEIRDSPLLLRPHPKFEDRLIGRFRLKGTGICDDAVVSTSSPGLPVAEALANVVVDMPQDREFMQFVEFERQTYEVRVGSRKTLRLYAKYPELATHPFPVKLESSEPDKVATIGGCTLTPVAGANYAVGEVKIEGRVLKGKTKIRATVNGHTAQADVKVVDQVDESKGVPIDIKLVPVDLGNFRARWTTYDGKPNVLQISAVHKSLSRYLGREEDKYPGQNTPMFRVLIAEIVAESICRKALLLEAKERPLAFDFTGYTEPDVIIDDVCSHLHRRLRQFVADAHAIMLPARDLEIASRDVAPEASSPGGRVVALVAR